MKNKKRQFATLRRKAAANLIAPVMLLCLFWLFAPTAKAQNSDAAPGTVFVHTALGGFILGYDIDQSGTEGLLSESLTLGNGNYDVAVETFDQKTGKILKIVRLEKETHNDYVTLGIFGNSVGLFERELSKGLFVDKRVYRTINPVDANMVTGGWTPPLTKDEIILGVGSSQGSANTAVLAFENGGNDRTFVFGSNVAANTFGPLITLTNPIFSSSNSPVFAVDTLTNHAVVASSFGAPLDRPTIAEVDLATGKVSEFPGLGFGYVNGIAVDSANGIAVTSTEIDFSLEFYDLAKQTGFIVPLQGATSQSQSGGDVEFDPVHKLFLVGQEFSSTAPRGSSIQVFDEKGNFVEAINGLSLPASPTLIALKPSQRSGYVLVTPALTELQSFTY